MISKEDLRIEIRKIDGQWFVLDFGKGVKSSHPDKLTAEAFVASILSVYNGTQA